MGILCCPHERCKGEIATARSILADCFAKEVELARRFEATLEQTERPRRPILCREVNEVLERRDAALARLGEWSV